MKGRILAASIVWLVILGIIVVAYKLIYKPLTQQKAEIAVKEEIQKKFNATSSDSRYDLRIAFGVDSFSGYSVVRSKQFQEELAANRIELVLVDDGANYLNRIKALNSGELQFATFTIDALIKCSAELKSLPAVIVAIIDETRGADAMVAYKDVVPNIDALNDPSIQFVLTADSPSETLARVVTTNFDLKSLSANSFVKVLSAKDVYNAYRKSNHQEKKVFVLWQPYISKVLENPNTHVVIDSSKFRGYIVDVLVVNRDFLYKNHDIVKKVVASYLRANYANKDQMVKLVLEDAKLTGEPVTDKQSEDLVNGVWWKNTQENYAHFGIDQSSLQHIEDIIKNITRVLVASKAITVDPMDGKPNTLYYDKILRELHDSQFHPGIENIREDKLPALTNDDWKKLKAVGTLEVPEIHFARGTNIISDRGKIILDSLITNLATFPNYYIVIQGNSTSVGDAEANKKLASDRAEAVKQYFLERGIAQERMQAISKNALGSSSVTFILGQMPY